MHLLPKQGDLVLPFDNTSADFWRRDSEYTPGGVFGAQDLVWGPGAMIEIPMYSLITVKRETGCTKPRGTHNICLFVIFGSGRS